MKVLLASLLLFLALPAPAEVVALRAAEQPGGEGQVIDLSLLEPIHSTLARDWRCPLARAWSTCRTSGCCRD